MTEPSKILCGRCYDLVEKPLLANCEAVEDALGMFHCPDCGAMCLGGVPHPPLCQTCFDRKHPGFDEGR